MGLEHWDAARRKYVLYRNPEQHNADCDRFPFERIPRKVYLDTNVINVLVKHSAHVFEQQPIPVSLEPILALDIEALMHVFFVGARVNWSILGSQKTIDELSRTRDGVLRDNLLEYGLEIADQNPDNEDCRFAADFGRRMIDAPFVAALPDVADRELIGNAIALGCDAFCTCDRATIVSKRGLLKQVTMRILTPAEWWAHIKPWAGLWC
jgi:hypothetical protein